MSDPVAQKIEEIKKFVSDAAAYLVSEEMLKNNQFESDQYIEKFRERYNFLCEEIPFPQEDDILPEEAPVTIAEEPETVPEPESEPVAEPEPESVAEPETATAEEPAPAEGA